MKKITVVIELEFEDNINSDGDIDEVTSNVLDAIVYAADREGIAPDDASYTFTKNVKVSNAITNSSYKKDLMKL